MAGTPTKKPVGKNRIVERCWTLVGRHQGPFWYARRVRQTRGEPARVAFDAEWVNEREESKADIVGFYHTHPSGSPLPSNRDDRTMRAWAGSFGKPMLCLIEADGEVAAYEYHDDEEDAVPLAACELLPRGIIVAYQENLTDGE